MGALHIIEFLTLWENKNEAALWQLAADAFDTRERATRQERKESSRKLPVELLEPIRNLYWATNAGGRPVGVAARIMGVNGRAIITIDDDCPRPLPC